jgi:hypothetical protein
MLRRKVYLPLLYDLANNVACNPLKQLKTKKDHGPEAAFYDLEDRLWTIP